MTVTIRPATPDDRAAMLTLWVDAWTALFPDIDFAARVPWMAERLDGFEQQGVAVLVAEVDGVAAGFVTVDPVTHELDQLAIARARQRQGVGRALIGAAKSHSPDGLFLKVNERNDGAIRLYESQGFRVVGTGVSSASGLPLFHMRWP